MTLLGYVSDQCIVGKHAVCPHKFDDGGGVVVYCCCDCHQKTDQDSASRETISQESKECSRCKEQKPLADFVSDTDCCLACHEFDLMRETGAGVVKRGPIPGIALLNGEWITTC